MEQYSAGGHNAVGYHHGSDLPPAPPLPTPPAKGEVVISGAKTVRGGEKLTFSVTIDGKNVPNSDLEWTLYPADASLATIKSGVITTKRVAYTHYVQVSAALKSDRRAMRTSACALRRA